MSDSPIASPFVTPEQQLTALAKTRANLDGSDAVVWWCGDVYSWAPGEANKHLFGFEGLNVAKLTPIEGGYEMLSREAAFYLDPRSREILEKWDNPVTEESVDVLHIWNDPVNQKWLVEGPRGPFRIPMTVLGDKICFNMDVPLAYPSPLPVAEWPDNSADDIYRALELFQFFAPLSEVQDESLTSASHELSWVRMSPWLPWMRMGQRPGGLLFHTRGYKMNSYAELPERTRAYIDSTKPEYATAPDAWSEPNETSWTYFRRMNQEPTA